MDVRQLRYFLAVVDHNGISRAAEQLRVAQPSLSQAIATFERELGMPLFHRIGRGLVLSEAGIALVGPARVVLRDLDEAKAVMSSLKGLRGGRIDIVTMPSPGMEPLTTILTTFSRRCWGWSAPVPPRSASWVPRSPPQRPTSTSCRWNVKPWC